jgi:hypothetical protein
MPTIAAARPPAIARGLMAPSQAMPNAFNAVPKATVATGSEASLREAAGYFGAVR